ncbi:hypothetical protein I4U23_011141 [Adineta vaga]|nr:hypothetical protein I4U23_011141 [Adineta vaga]
MANNQVINDTNTLISIQVNGKKAVRTRCPLSKTVAELREILSSEKVSLPINVQFLDAQGYPVTRSDEKLRQINELIILNNDDNIIHM